MRWQHTEFVLKGIFLGLLVFVALQKPTWDQTGIVGLTTLAGLTLFLGIAALRKLREGYRVKGRLAPFLLFLVLENPGLVYAGVLLGLLSGAFLIRKDTITLLQTDFASPALLACCAATGAALGFVFLALRQVPKTKIRLWSALALAAALAGGTALLVQQHPDLLLPEQRLMLGALLLLGIPFFYLLSFASLVEESEVEVAVECAALGAGLWLLGGYFGSWYTLQWLVLILPVAVYLFYTRNVLPGLRVFKHVLRGMSYASVGHHRWALVSLNRALELDPCNKLAQQELWDIHRRMDLSDIADDKDTLALVNFELCLERAGFLLLNPPSPEQLAEATRLLSLVSTHKPEMLPRCEYWRAVAALHQRNYAQAAEHLSYVIAGAAGESENPHRLRTLLPAWHLALSHPEMQRRVAEPHLATPGRRMEILAAVEQQLAQDPKDAAAQELKARLYNEVTEQDYDAFAGAGKAALHFDHRHVYDRGMALLEDSEHWRRGAEYLRMAVRGLPEAGPAVYVRIAKACQKAGEFRDAWHNYELAKQAGRAAGPQNLSPDDRDLYFHVVKMLADAAREEGDLDRAIENYRLYTEAPAANVETYRTLADLYERKKDVWSALHATEHALIHGKKSDADLVARKDRYYYSIEPDDLRRRWETVKNWFDIDYCVRKARALLERHGNDLELIDWAGHLAELAHVAQPSNLAVRLLQARVRRLRGEIPEAVAILEGIRGDRPERFASSDDEEAWYAACKLLGDLYLNEKPDVALQCLLEYKKYPKSGADTYYKLGMAYEALGDWTRAARCYEQVTAYEGHPLAGAAYDALDRLRTASG